jgi:hypothetical protein
MVCNWMGGAVVFMYSSVLGRRCYAIWVCFGVRLNLREEGFFVLVDSDRAYINGVAE